MTAISADAPIAELPPRDGVYRLGVFGSMMNPPHNGHVSLVDAVHRACGLHRVAVVPAGIPPHRRAPSVSARARLTMTVRAFADLDHAVVVDSEVERGEHNEIGYMVDTIEELLEMPETLGYDDLVVQPWLVVGADQAATLTSWHRWPRIAELANLAVVTRPAQLANESLDATLAGLREAIERVDLVTMEPVDISSTSVRSAAALGDRAAVAGMVPPAIVDDVLHLYAEPV